MLRIAIAKVVWVEVIGLEYGIGCQTTKDFHLSHGHPALLWLDGIYLVIHSTLPSLARKEEKEQATGGLTCRLVESESLCSLGVRVCELWIPQSPGVICVIITIITLRL